MHHEHHSRLYSFSSIGSAEINEEPLRSQMTSVPSVVSQYDFAQMTRRTLGSPVKMHSPGSEESSSGIARIVTLRSCLICSSISREPFQCARAKPPWIFGFAGFFGEKKS